MDFRNQASYPIGLRNNNPGNIRPGDKWQGMVGVNNNFVVFSSIAYGIRALGTDVSNKIFSGLDTVRKIISKYAPPSENNTEAYIQAVSKSTGVLPDIKITLNDAFLKKIVRAIMNHENGASYSAKIPDSEIETGLSMMSPQIVSRIKGFL